MTLSSYSELLRDPRWKAKRNEILSRDNYTCQKCFEIKSNLHVHHKFYKAGSLPWEYDNDALVTLCESCHSLEHDKPCSNLGCIIGCVHISNALGLVLEHTFKLMPPDEQKATLANLLENGDIDKPLFAFAVASLEIMGA